MKLKLLTRCSTALLLTLACPSSYAEPSNINHYQELEDKIANKNYKKITSVLVDQNGKRIYEKYFNEGNKSFKNDIRSASKSITAMLFGIAVKEGIFESENDKVLNSFEDKFPIQNLTKKKQEMTFKDLMMMNPPMECNDWNDLSRGNEERMYLLEDWEKFALDLPNRGIPPWELKAKDRPYGVAFSYCTAGVFLVGSAIARETKIGLDKFAEKKLFMPLSINDVDWVYSPLDIAQGGGGLKIKSKDLMKIGNLILNKGLSSGNQIISSSWVEKMLQTRSIAIAENNTKYGYLWWIFEFNHNNKKVTAYAAAGNGGNYLWVVPELNLTAVITSTAFNTPYMHKQSQEIFEKIVLKSVL